MSIVDTRFLTLLQRSERSDSVRTVAQYLLILSLAVIFFFPVAWIFLTLLKPSGEVYAWPPRFFPVEPTLIN